MALTRRQFLQAGAASSLTVALAPWMPTQAASAHAHGHSRRVSEIDWAKLGTPPEIKGHNIDLVVDETRVNYTGRDRRAITINGSLPAPTLRWQEGETVTIRVTNRLNVDTSIHWHGLILPFDMDGVPGVSFDGIKPGETFTYSFTLEQSGTYWYHSHSGMQEQQGMYGAIIIDPIEADPVAYDREQIVLLSDWTDEDPHRIIEKLKIKGHYYNRNEPTVLDFWRDVRELGFRGAMQKRQMWQQMRMSPTDLADITGYTYTFLTNGLHPDHNWTTLFKPGEKVRLRYINASAATYFDVRIPGLVMSVVQADGQNVQPVAVDEFRFGPGETYDVIVEPKQQAYTLFAQSIDRSGVSRGTLAVREGLTAPVPEMDKVEWLADKDMMGAMDHSAHAGHAGHGDHADHADHSAHPTDDAHAGHGGQAMQHDHPGHHAHHGHHGHHAMADDSLAKPSTRVHHARTAYGASVDMRVDTPRTNLDDPGMGLRNNGRRVLTYADLKTLDGPLDPRGPEREIVLHLTGNMHRYTWSIDGLEYGKSEPIHFAFGERIRVIMHNDTMMTHPMHLHGMWSELESPEGEFLVRKHTVSVQPAQRISFLVTADALGRWVWHCHIMYHMDTGMFREVVVS
ncbi:copper resistance system multicopper oxidase [Thiomicrospira microaerophila]|uniref:copper resistance system multicopper oxidase n=1 Tax=Thiomicrospira microaerophila TaxID=406020 RepID=UPI00200C1470|nr:copper resistance system multicopper oxidase [Thiomicrospira microaerophila]UQB42219.1 copper resistance system multicopper oxidase [Thiomicrospira microaerophila]